jgi:hypothetical protein
MEPENNQNSQTEVQETKPNESTGIYVRGFIKISDPESGEVMVETAK